MDESASEIILHESSGFKEHGSDEELVVARETLLSKRNEDLKKYSLIELDLGKEGEYRSIISNAKNDLIETYRKVGIDIGSDDFPVISLVELDRLTTIDAQSGEVLSDTFGGAYGLKLDRVRVFVRGEDQLLLDAKHIHHELHHSLGEKQLVISKPRRDEVSEVQLARSGYYTKGSQKDKSVRGEVVEEGLVEYLARDFVLHSDLPLVIEARQGYAARNWKECSDEVKRNLELKESDIRKLCFFGLFIDSSKRYNDVSRIVESIILKAERDGGEGLEMQDLLIVAREKVGKRRKLVQEVDRLFGKGLGSKLFQAKFEDGQVAELAEEFTLE